jgi:hypothetical protein
MHAKFGSVRVTRSAAPRSFVTGTASNEAMLQAVVRGTVMTPPPRRIATVQGKPLTLGEDNVQNIGGSK